MNLFDAIPKELFSVLASPNRAIYANALDVLHDAYGETFKITEEMFYTMLRSRLEDQLEAINFDDEDIEEEERTTVSGRARFLIRKLHSKGWFQKERGKDFQEYIIVPDYSSALLDLFYAFTHESTPRGFSYVFGTYSSLKTADETDDAEIKMMAVYSARDNIFALTKLLKKVYHNVNQFFKLQMDMKNINDVLATHFDDFGERVMETYIRPLKIKDSVPKYREPIYAILDRWLEDEALLQAIAQAAFLDKRGATLKACQTELCSMIFAMKAEYGRIETEYLAEIDEQVRRYTRATTQKIENLTNRDQNTKGNLNYLLSKLAETKKSSGLVEELAPLFEIYEQETISPQSLWHRKRPRKRDKSEPLTVDVEPISDAAKDGLTALLRHEYSKETVYAYVNSLLQEQDVVYSKDIAPADDYHYILSLLTVLDSTDKASVYQVKLLEGNMNCAGYRIPQFEIRKKEKKL